MKQFHKALALLMLFALLSGCVVKEDPLMSEIMPDDFNFSVRFGITSKNVINTFDDQVTKDLIANGTITTDLALTNEEMKSIYDRMREVNIWRDLKLDPGDTGCGQIPFGEDFWKIEMNGEIKEFYWSDKTCTITKDAEQLKELRGFVLDIVMNKKKYKDLPESVGGYD